jgi:hypothetical protein
MISQIIYQHDQRHNLYPSPYTDKIEDKIGETLYLHATDGKCIHDFSQVT